MQEENEGGAVDPGISSTYSMIVLEHHLRRYLRLVGIPKATNDFERGQDQGKRDAIEYIARIFNITLEE